MKSLRARLLASMLGVALALIITLSIVFFNSLQGSMETVLKNTILPLAEQTADKISLNHTYVAYHNDKLPDILDSIRVSDGNIAFVIKSDGTIVSHSTNAGVISSETNILRTGRDNLGSISEFASQAVKATNGYGKFTYDGEEYIAGFSEVEGFDETLIVAVPADEFTQYSSSSMRDIIIACIILVAAVSIFSLFFAKTFSKPIQSTTNRLRALAQGNLTDPVDVHYSRDELGVLSKSLEETILSLRQYINLITVALTNISEGNLCHRMEGTFKGDFLKIKSTFNTILESLSDTFASINTAAEEVNSGAMQVSNAAQALSQGSTEQASSIEQLSATLTDVANQITYNANAAKDAYKIVQDNTDSINDCNEDMTKMLAAMNEISDSSDQISKIIKVIDDIAFQTNILALNAAVEAAREGSKGFGVVADEVRRLAAKSAEAAKQTASLIEESTAAVKRGLSIATVTADSLHVIVENSAQIKKLTKDITDASEHQSEAVVQINAGVDQISSVVAANTSSAVGSASASEELSSQSLILKNMIARFRLSDKHQSSSTGTSQYAYYTDDDDFDGSDTAATPDSSSFVSKYAYPSDDPDDTEPIKIVLDDDDDKY